MPKRGRENQTPTNGEAAAVKSLNLAYGAVNKAGDAIPADPIVRPKISTPRERQLRVVAWNLNGLRAFLAKRPQELRKLWESEQVDILGITEHKITEIEKTVEIEKSIRELIPDEIALVWNMCKGKKGYSGSLAIVRKSVMDQAVSVEFGLGGKPDLEGRVITLEFKNCLVVIAYVPNSGQTLERLHYRTNQWDKDLSAHCLEMGKGGRKSVILAGDLNVAHRDLDIWNVDAPHVPKGAGTTPQERAGFQTELLSKAGFIDSFTHMHPVEKGWFSYWSVRAGNKPRNRGLRLDYVLVTEKVKLLDAFIAGGFAKEGDHCPVGVVVEIDSL